MDVLEDEYIAEIKGLTYGRDAVGTVVQGEQSRIGKKVFVEYAVPGETVKVRAKKEEKSFIRSELLEVINTSNDRVSPPCEVFGKCGGCELQHIEPKRQRELKQEMVLSMLAKQGGIQPLEVAFLGKDIKPWNYRNKVVLHLNTDGHIGFFESGSSNIVDIKYCYIASKLINQGIEQIKLFHRELCEHASSITIQENQTLYIDINLTDFGQSENYKPSSAFFDRFPNTTLSYNDEVVYSNIEHSFPTGHFSQVNDEGNLLLTEAVCSLVKESNILELYAGSGNFAFPLAKLGKKIDAVEIDFKLVEYGRQIANKENLSNQIKFIHMSCEKFVKGKALPETVLLDPPRSGAKNIMQAFQNAKTKQVIYISCDLPNFCRDAKMLSGYGYKLQKLFLIDMFPQTHHIELLANFTN